MGGRFLQQNETFVETAVDGPMVAVAPLLSRHGNEHETASEYADCYFPS